MARRVFLGEWATVGSMQAASFSGEVEKLRHATVHFSEYLCFRHNAWVVGGAALTPLESWGELKDVDILVPCKEWQNAVSFVMAHLVAIKPNRFGGWKGEIDRVSVDVWPGHLEELAATVKFKAAWQLALGIRLYAEKNP